MTKERFNEGVKAAETVIESYLDDRNSPIAKETALRACQFMLDLHDHLEVTGLIKKLFKE